MFLTQSKGTRARRHTVAAALATALVAFAPGIEAQVTTSTSTPPAAARARCVGCPSDSSRMRREQLITKLESLRTEFEHRRLSAAEQEILSKAMAATIMALQEFLEASARGGIARSERDQLARDVAREAMRMSGAAVAVAVQSGFGKRGYLGIVFDGPSYEYRSYIRFYQYPKIASVDHSSPAERAGVLVGDTLLAFNGTDVIDHTFSLTKLLIPDEKITMKIRRDGNVKEFRVLVGEAPDYVISRVPSAAAVGVVAPETPMPPMQPTEVRVRVPMRAPPAPTAMPGQFWIFSDGVAGARLEAITEGLGRAVGAKEGVLVIRVSPGTPAYHSGLRDGDVILSAAGTAISTVQKLRRVVADGDGNEGVKLVILRERKQRDVILHW